MKDSRTAPHCAGCAALAEERRRRVTAEDRASVAALALAEIRGAIASLERALGSYDNGTRYWQKDGTTLWLMPLGSARVEGGRWTVWLMDGPRREAILEEGEEEDEGGARLAVEQLMGLKGLELIHVTVRAAGGRP